MTQSISSTDCWRNNIYNGSGRLDAFSAEGRKETFREETAFKGQGASAARSSGSKRLQPSTEGAREDRSVSSETALVSESDTADSSSYPVKYQKPTGEPLDRREIALLEQLKRVDQNVRRHEAAHVAAGGVYVRKGASYSYAVGPDGNRYAVAGEVSIDTSEEADPHATLAKMRIVQRAALAPMDPSPQDRAVAAMAAQLASAAMLEIARLQYEKNMGSSNPQAQDASGGSRVDLYV